MKKASSTSTIIGKSDGPTAVFLIGRKEKNVIRRIKQIYLNMQHKLKRKIAERKIKPEYHTIQETIDYIKMQYHAIEVDSAYPYYLERKKQMKLHRINIEQPSLLGETTKIKPSSDFNNTAAVNEWMAAVDEQNTVMMQRADAIPNEVFPTDYHLFVIKGKNDESMEIEIDTYGSVIACGYTGNMKKIYCDIQTYYGVTQEDINNRTYRYLYLLSCTSY